MMLSIERHWYRRSLTWLTLLLLPFSYVFRILVKLRFLLYRFGVFKITRFPVPVIIVGNLAVGGTGKTPTVLWLAHFLKAHGWRPGIVSRGMGGEKQFSPVWVDAYADPKGVGDEAILLARHSARPVVVCIDRVAAVRELLKNTNCNVVLSDDGLQHYRLGRRIEIAVLDGDRQLGNGYMLPAGPLREAPQRLEQVDFVVQQGGEVQRQYCQMRLEGDELVSVVDALNKVPLAEFKNTKVHAVAGVGNPERFFAALRCHGLEIVEHVFPDHYLYREEDLGFADEWPVVMTEKDKVKCEAFANERFWYLPVRVVMDEWFGDELLLRLQDK